MDGSRFDAWTRRGFGVAAGGLAGSALALSAIPGAEAGRGKKKKKRCKKLGDVCNDGKKKCCCGYGCQTSGMSVQKFCCRAAGFPAERVQDCCSGKLELGKCVCKTLGQPCNVPQECCSGSCDDTCVDPTR